MFGEVKGGGVSLVMQSLKRTPMAHEAQEYPAMLKACRESYVPSLGAVNFLANRRAIK